MIHMKENAMPNPFREDTAMEDGDRALVSAALDGDRDSLEKLILNHQAWIYNLAFKMIMDHDDASDITQEIIIKIITNLGSYDPEKAAFRTWVYRIVVNHVLNMKRRKFETRIHDFDAYVSIIERLPDDTTYAQPDAAVLAEEVKVGCMTGMLLCLKRSERMAFLLGAVFAVRDTVGSEVMGVSRDSFRQMLSRSRKKVFNYMNGICGHINPDNPCRCSHKVKSFLALGMMDPARLRYHRPSAPMVKDMIGSRLADFQETYYGPFLEQFREHPFYDPPDVTSWLREILEQRELRELFNLDEE
ncbi:MAG: RNA polymerase sigma factor [Desulfobacterota bacterium]|nr:RNA polymerase sigma factor [Thermodesulfobacteriota bacterium]